MSAVASTPGEDGPGDLESRLVRAEAEIAGLRHDLLVSRAEVRALAEAIPAAVSRRAVVRSIVADLAHPARWFAPLRRRARARRAR